MPDESAKVESTPTTRPARSRRLSASDPPEVFEGVLNNLDRYADELAARREAMGLPDGRTMWSAEDLAVIREALGMPPLPRPADAARPGRARPPRAASRGSA